MPSVWERGKALMNPPQKADVWARGAALMPSESPSPGESPQPKSGPWTLQMPDAGTATSQDAARDEEARRQRAEAIKTPWMEGSQPAAIVQIRLKQDPALLTKDPDEFARKTYDKYSGMKPDEYRKRVREMAAMTKQAAAEELRPTIGKYGPKHAYEDIEGTPEYRAWLEAYLPFADSGTGWMRWVHAKISGKPKPTYSEQLRPLTESPITGESVDQAVSRNVVGLAARSIAPMASPEGAVAAYLTGGLGRLAGAAGGTALGLSEKGIKTAVKTGGFAGGMTGFSAAHSAAQAGAAGESAVSAAKESLTAVPQMLVDVAEAIPNTGRAAIDAWKKGKITAADIDKIARSADPIANFLGLLGQGYIGGLLLYRASPERAARLVMKEKLSRADVADIAEMKGSSAADRAAARGVMADMVGRASEPTQMPGFMRQTDTPPSPGTTPEPKASGGGGIVAKPDIVAQPEAAPGKRAVAPTKGLPSEEKAEASEGQGQAGLLEPDAPSQQGTAGEPATASPPVSDARLPRNFVPPKKPVRSESEIKDARGRAAKYINDAELLISRNKENLAESQKRPGNEREKRRHLNAVAEENANLQSKIASMKKQLRDTERAAGMDVTYPTSKDTRPTTESATPPDVSATEMILKEAESKFDPNAPRALQSGAPLPAALTPKPYPESKRAVPEAITAPLPEMEAAIQNASGIKRSGIIEKTKRAVREAWHGLTRAQIELANTAENSSYNEFFRLLKNIPDASSDREARVVGAVVHGLTPDQYEVFRRATLANNMASELNAGLPLRFRSTREAVAAFKKKMDTAVEADPAVKLAIAKRRAVNRELAEEAVKNGLLDKSALEHTDDYMHQQVLQLAAVDRIVSGTKPTKIERGFQKKRYGGDDEALPEDLDYNTDYVGPELKWRTEARVDINKEKLIDEFIAPSDRIGEARAKAKADGKDLSDIIRGDYKDHLLWQAKPGHVFYRAFTIPEKLAEAIQAGEVGFSELLEKLPKSIREAVALGGPQRQMLLPKHLVKQLESMRKSPPSGHVADAARSINSAWKIRMLLFPDRVIGFSARNVTGDNDPVLAALPSAYKFVKGTTIELYDYYLKDKKAIGNELEKVRDLGVIQSSITMQEFGAEHKQWPFSDVTRGETRGIERAAGLPRGYIEMVTKLGAFRESILRYSAYKAYLEQIRNGTLKHYGTSKKSVVDALIKNHGAETAAAHLARNLLGDYGNLTVFGNWMRRYLYPFWSWNEIELKRYPRLFENAVRAGSASGAAKATAFGMGYAALRTSFLLARIPALTAAVSVFNHSVFPKEEEELSSYSRANPHVILGRRDDGSIIVFRNVGALGDFTEWFGFNTILSLYPQWRDGKIGTADVIQEAMKTPANKALQGMRPDLKALYEIPAGKSMFPDAFNQRDVGRDELLANVFGASDYYLWARGEILQDGTRARPHTGTRMLGVGVEEPRRNALSDIYDLRNRFLESKGRSPETGRGATPWTLMRRAAETIDYEAFKEARTKWLEQHRGQNIRMSYQASLRAVDPLAGSMSKPLVYEFTNRYLDDIGRRKLSSARDLAMELKTRIVDYWKQSEKEERAK